MHFHESAGKRSLGTRAFRIRISWRAVVLYVVSGWRTYRLNLSRDSLAIHSARALAGNSGLSVPKDAQCLRPTATSTL